MTGELASLVVRLCVLIALSIFYITRYPSAAPSLASDVAVAVMVVVTLGYTGLTLLIMSRARGATALAVTGGLIDAVTATVFLAAAFLGAHDPSPALAGVAALAYGLSVVAALTRLVPGGVLAASAAGVLGSGSVIILAFLQGSEISPVWVLIPAGVAALGLASTLAVYTARRALERALITDELRRASRRLRMTMEIVLVSVAKVAQMVTDLQRVAASLSDGERSQAKSVERVLSSIGAMGASQEQIYRTTEASTKTIRRTVDSSDTGNRVVRRVIDEIGSITDSVERMVSSLETMDNIADNTNLLALNANIEANRGSTESMGFSVVADEIRKLAEQSQQTALEVGRLVKQVAKVIFTANTSSRNAGQVFERVYSDLSGYADYVNNLHLSVQEQLKANREVHRSITRIHEVTLSHTQATDTLREVADQLQEEVTKLRALLDGKITETARYG